MKNIFSNPDVEVVERIPEDVKAIIRTMSSDDLIDVSIRAFVDSEPFSNKAEIAAEVVCFLGISVEKAFEHIDALVKSHQIDSMIVKDTVVLH
jgi:predicted SnoaL-like aldol condensation-catalyzing enzyme